MESTKIIKEKNLSDFQPKVAQTYTLPQIRSSKGLRDFCHVSKEVSKFRILVL